MLTAPRRRTILNLSLPIIGGMVSQNVLNLIDTAMVGHLGDAALAAVGIGGFVAFIAAALVIGLGAGVQAMASRRVGEGESERAAIPLNGGLLLVVCMALPLTVVLTLVVPYVMPYLVDDPEVVALGTPYLQVRMFGIAATGVNFVFRGYWNGVSLSRLYMRTLVVMHITNAVVNYVLIFGAFGFPELGTTGAAIGTTASLYVGSIYYVWLGFGHAKAQGFFSGLPDAQTIKTMVRISVPAGVQNLFFSLGLTVFFVMLGWLGTKELAASQVLVNIMLVAILPGIGFGLASATLVGQALGRAAAQEAQGWGEDVAKLAMMTVAVLMLPVAVFPELLLGVFLHDPATLEVARGPMRLIALVIPIDVGGTVLMNSLIGAGESKTPMVGGVLAQWCYNLPAVYVTVTYLGGGMMDVWLIHVSYRVLYSVIFLVVWRRGRWKEVKV